MAKHLPEEQGDGLQSRVLLHLRGLIEGTRGDVQFDGVFALEEFFRAVSEARIYLIGRPGPHINAEVVVGGMPGWLLLGSFGKGI